MSGWTFVDQSILSTAASGNMLLHCEGDMILPNSRVQSPHLEQKMHSTPDYHTMRVPLLLCVVYSS